MQNIKNYIFYIRGKVGDVIKEDDEFEIDEDIRNVLEEYYVDFLLRHVTTMVDMDREGVEFSIDKFADETEFYTFDDLWLSKEEVEKGSSEFDDRIVLTTIEFVENFYDAGYMEENEYKKLIEDASKLSFYHYT